MKELDYKKIPEGFCLRVNILDWREFKPVVQSLDSEWVLAWIELTCWEWSVDILYAEHLESLEENLSAVLECISTVVRETLANEDMTIEACESWDCVDTDTTE